jgi:hypothetical protein
MRAVLGNDFTGLYLHGSLASGDFDLATSDIDFAAVTAGDLSSAAVAALETMHRRLNDTGLAWARKLEGSYIPLKAMRRYHPQDGPFPCVNEGAFYLARHESHWVIARAILREHGLVLAGPSPASLIDPVSPGEIRQAVQDFLQEWWAPMLEPAMLHRSRLESPEYQAYAVLTMCRALFTLNTGQVASKPISAAWAQSTLEVPWSDLIAWALDWKAHPGPNRLAQTRALIGLTLERV